MERTIRTHDGLTLRGREWPASAGRGTIVLVHGLGEHVGRYEHVAAALGARGWRVLAFDQRGHGASEGERGRLGAADDLLADLAPVLDLAHAGAPRPLVLLGHSAGGAVAARFVAGGLESPRPGWYRPVDALVLSSPALATSMSMTQKALLATLGPVPNLAVGSGLKPNGISRDPAVVAAYVADPLVHDRIASRLARFIIDAGDAVRDLAPRCSVPTLLLYAGSDRIVPPAGSAAFAAAAPAGVVTTHVFPALFHEIFNEPEKEQVLSILADWLDTLAASPERSPR